MDTAYAHRSIRQMRRELRDMVEDLDTLEKLIDDTDYAAYCVTNAGAIAFHANDLSDCHRFFNLALRYLLAELANAAQDAARNQHVDFDADFAKAHLDA